MARPQKVRLMRILKSMGIGVSMRINRDMIPTDSVCIAKLNTNFLFRKKICIYNESPINKKTD